MHDVVSGDALSSDALNSDALNNFATIWEHVECGITIIDAASREILAINPVAARMFGDGAAKILGKRCHKFICPAEDNSCPIMDKGQSVDRSERKFVRADGRTLPIIKSVSKIQYKGRLALLESFTDISNLKEAEKKLLRLSVAEEASQAKSAFLSRVSHEMRTPMNAIIGMAKIAERTDDLARLRRCLATINTSADHLLGLINDVLDMSKIEAGKLELDEAAFSVEDMLRKVCGLVAGQMAAKDIVFRVLFDGAMSWKYNGDALRLSQVITNLMSNAVKFTPSGGEITLSVDGSDGNEAGVMLRFALADTGIGMTDEQIARLFNPFEQADASIPGRFGGTGLGLAISKSIIEKMGGSISVASTPGKGSVFTVAVRLKPARPPAGAHAEARVFSRMKTLVVDADEGSRRNFSFLRARHGVLVDEAGGGAAALAALAAAQTAGEPYDAVFVAYELGGGVVTSIAELLGPAGTARRLILMAPFALWNSVDGVAKRAGITNLLAKPQFPSDIVAALDTVTGNDSAPSLSGQSPPGPDGNGVADFSGLTVLLAEDVAINREIFAALLEETRARIETAGNGAEAVAMFRADPDRYDIIIMDILMPGMDGYEAAIAIRNLDFAKAKNVPIVAMSANVFKEDIEKCLRCGMNDHLAKPIDEKAVIAKIMQYCK